jgi:hypothetical protein
MSSTDRSSAGRTRQLRSRTLAASFGKAVNPNDSSSWQAIKVGRGGHVIQLTGSGTTVTVPGCCNTIIPECLPVCDLSDDEIFTIDNSISNILGLQDFINSGIIGSVTIPSPHSGYLNDFFYIVSSFNGCNVTDSTTIMYDASGDLIPSTQHYLGDYPTANPGPYDYYNTIAFNIIYPTPFIENGYDYLASYDVSGISAITVTVSNECSSNTGYSILGCFLAGTPVALADGTTKAIEDVAVGDLVVGAFGEANPVLALQRPLLADSKVCRINDEHTTTTHHPHIGSDRQFYCPDPDAIKRVMYGKTHTIIHGDGSTEERLMTGVNPDRIKKLELGTALQTITGPRSVAKIEPLPMSSDTQVYHLVVGGSHTYTVDGYAVVGWATETDFDYDTWLPKVRE